MTDILNNGALVNMYYMVGNHAEFITRMEDVMLAELALSLRYADLYVTREACRRAGMEEEFEELIADDKYVQACGGVYPDDRMEMFRLCNTMWDATAALDIAVDAIHKMGLFN